MAMKRKNLPELVPQVFEHEEFGQFRFIKRDEEIWFVANDVCRVLGYANPRDALAKHVCREMRHPWRRSNNGDYQRKRTLFAHFR